MASNQERLELIISAKNQAATTLDKLKSSIIGIGTAYLSWQVAKTFLVDSVKAAIESEKVYDGLSDAIERHGGSWKVVEQRVRDFTSALQQQLGVSDEVVAQGLQTLIDAGMNTSKAMDAMRTATDLAAGAHIELDQAIDLVAKASLGITRGFNQVKIVIDDSLDPAQKYEEVLRKINEKFGGAAADAMDTTAGKIKLLSESFGELREAIGKLIISIPKLPEFITNFTRGLNLMADALDRGVFWLVTWYKLIEINNPVLEERIKAIDEIDKLLGGVAKRQAAAMGAQGDATMDSIKKLSAWREEQRKVIALQDEGTISIDKTVTSITRFATVASPAVREILREWANGVDKVALGYGKLSPLQKKLLEELRAGAKTWQKQFDELSGTVKTFAGAMQDAVQGSISNQVQQLEIFHQRAKTVFGQMAQDFTTIFIKAIGEAIARAVARWVVMLLFFDKPENDRKALQSGLDFAKHFSAGVFQGFGNLLPASKMIGAGSGLAIGAGQSTGGNITINFLGPITNRQFVEDEIIPVIEKAIVNKKSYISYNRQPITGKAQMAF